MNLSIELINAIMQYLGNRPYVEVAQIIAAIQAEAAKKPEPEQSGDDNG